MRVREKEGIKRVEPREREREIRSREREKDPNVRRLRLPAFLLVGVFLSTHRLRLFAMFS